MLVTLSGRGDKDAAQLREVLGGAVEQALRADRPALVGYVMAGIRPDWVELVAAMADAGADAIEIGLPFSDPSLDGPVIQQASHVALRAGTTVEGALDRLGRADPGVPLVAMTYLNHLVVRGPDRFLGLLADAGVAGCIVPDLPVAEADDHLAAARRAGLEATLMLGPNTPDPALELICRRSQGFIYVMSVMATTGSNAGSGSDTWRVAERARSLADLPVLVGFGIDGPRRAVEAARHADGVVVASALMRQVLAGAPVADVAAQVAGIRSALDGGPAGT